MGHSQKIKTRIQRLRHSGVFIVNFEHILHIVLVFLLLALSRQISAGKGIAITNAFQKISDESGRKPKEICVD